MFVLNTNSVYNFIKKKLHIKYCIMTSGSGFYFFLPIKTLSLSIEYKIIQSNIGY